MLPEKLSPFGARAVWEKSTGRKTRASTAQWRSKFSQSIFRTTLRPKQRFEREARPISSLNHPNICTLHDVGHQDGTDYLEY
jgi:eukaryotic-like serine/threonine-protein kinase